MPRKVLPRIHAVAPDVHPMTLRVRWDNGEKRLIDVSGMIQNFRVYEPLRHSPELFQQVRVGEHGTDVVWTDEIDMAADTLWRLTQEQAGETMTADAFRHWRDRKAYTLDEAARALGLSRRMVAYYEKGDHPIPRVVALATTIASRPGAGFSQMVEYEEIEDIDEMGTLNAALRSKLKSLSRHSEQRKINRVTGLNTVYFFDEKFWWSHRLYPAPPGVATQDNNLFGYGRPRASDTLISEIEVSLPVAKRRRVQGVFVRNRKTNSVILAHRGNNVKRGSRSFSLREPEFREALERTGASLIHVSGNPSPLIPVCSIDSPQLEDISEFVTNVNQAKNACS